MGLGRTKSQESSAPSARGSATSREAAGTAGTASLWLEWSDPRLHAISVLICTHVIDACNGQTKLSGTVTTPTKGKFLGVWEPRRPFSPLPGKRAEGRVTR